MCNSIDQLDRARKIAKIRRLAYLDGGELHEYNLQYCVYLQREETERAAIITIIVDEIHKHTFRLFVTGHLE